MCILRAGVAKLVYALDSKSSGLNAHVGSSPTSGTIPDLKLPPKLCWQIGEGLWHHMKHWG
jgi:hypothetical protein